MMTDEEQEQTTEEERMPTAPFTVMLRSGRHVMLKDVPDKILRRLCYKQLRSLKKVIYALAAHKAELDKRGYESEQLASFTAFKDFNMWQMMTHATLISLNNYNTHHPSAKITIIKEEEE